jgi:hypothetical protein
MPFAKSSCSLTRGKDFKKFFCQAPRCQLLCWLLRRGCCSSSLRAAAGPSNATAAGMAKPPKQLEALVGALPKLTGDGLRTVFEVCVARMKVRAQPPLL